MRNTKQPLDHSPSFTISPCNWYKQHSTTVKIIPLKTLTFIIKSHSSNHKLSLQHKAQSLRPRPQKKQIINTVQSSTQYISAPLPWEFSPHCAVPTSLYHTVVRLQSRCVRTVQYLMRPVRRTEAHTEDAQSRNTHVTHPSSITLSYCLIPWSPLTSCRRCSRRRRRWWVQYVRLVSCVSLAFAREASEQVIYPGRHAGQVQCESVGWMDGSASA